MKVIQVIIPTDVKAFKVLQNEQIVTMMKVRQRVKAIRRIGPGTATLQQPPNEQKILIRIGRRPKHTYSMVVVLRLSFSSGISFTIVTTA